MYSHMMVGSDDLDRSKTFYDALFGAVGGKPGVIDPKGRLVYVHNGAAFLVTKPMDGQPAACGNGMTIGFAMKSPEEADAWHKAGAAAANPIALAACMNSRRLMPPLVTRFCSFWIS